MAKEKKYMSLVESAEEYCKKQHDRWNDSIKQYKGEITAFRSKALKKWQHLIEVNLTRPTIDAMLPAIIFKNPKIFVRPDTELADQQKAMYALSIENKINGIISELGLAREVKLAIKDALLLGIGFTKLGLTGDVGYDVDKHPFAAPFIKRVSPWETFIDPAAREISLDDAEYVVFKTNIPLARARRDKTLDRPERLQATAAYDHLPEHLKEDKTSKLVSVYELTTLYELWHKGDGKFIVLDQEGEIYRNQDWPYDLQGSFPLVTFRFTSAPEEFYGIGEPEFIYSLQLEASEKRTQQLNHTRRFNRKYQVGPDMSKDDRDQLTEGEDGSVVVSATPVNVVADAPLQSDINTEYGMIIQELKEVTGISAYQRGGAESKVYSATAAQIIDANANIRIEERREEIANSISKATKILYNIIREQMNWPVMSFQFLVDVGSMQKPDDEGRRTQLLNLASIIKDFPEVKRDALLRDIAIAFNKPPEQYLYSPQEIQQMQQNQPPSPEQIKAQVEQQKLQMEGQKVQAEVQMKQQELQMKGQEAQVKMASEQQKLKMEMQKMQMELEIKKQEFELEKQKASFELQIEQQKMELETQKIKIQQQAAKQENEMKLQGMQLEHGLKTRMAENEMAMKEKEHDANVQLQMQKVQQDRRNNPSDKRK